MISGTPTQSVSNRQITIRAINNINSMTTTIVLSVMQRITALSYPQNTCSIVRRQAFTTTPSVTGDYVTFSLKVGSLPSGLQLNYSTGEITGTPTQSVSNYRSVIVARNALGELTVTLTFNIGDAITSFSYPQSEYILPKDVSFSATPIVSGDFNTYSVVSGTLPTGLSLNANTGVISGTPTKSVSNRQVTIKAQNSHGSRTTTLSFTIVSVSTLSYPQSTYSIAKGVSFSVSPNGSSDSVTYSIQSGSLPTGLSLNANTGVISGKATISTKEQSITVTAVNVVGSRSSAISIRVFTAITKYSYSNTDYTLVNGKRYKLTPSFSGEEPAFSVANGTLPDGLTLNAITGVIEGEPIDMFLKTTVYLMAKNTVSSFETRLTFTVLPLSMELLILIPILVILVIIALCMCCCCCRRKETMVVQSLDDLKDSLPEPVPAQPSQEVPSSTTAIVINPVQPAPATITPPMVNTQPMVSIPTMVNPQPMVNAQPVMNPGATTINPPIYQQVPTGNVFPVASNGPVYVV